jgi:hypothetical protein
MKSGIYQIVNVLDGKKYYGQSVDIPTRWRRHRYLLRCGKHRNHHLQHAFVKYGEANFKFEVVCYCEPAQLQTLEAKLIAHNAGGYNVTIVTAGKITHSAETRQKIAAAQQGTGNSYYGKKHSKAARQRMSDSHKAANLSDETRRKLSESHSGAKNHNYGKTCSAETRRKIGDANRGRKASPATRRKLSAMRKGKPKSEEHKRKIAEALRLKNRPSLNLA